MVGGVHRAGGGQAQIIARMSQQRKAKQKQQVTSPEQGTSVSQAATVKTRQKALATKAQSQKAEAAHKSATDKSGKQKKIQQQTQAVSAEKIDGNRQKLDESLSSTSSDTDTGKFVGQLSRTAKKSEMAKKVQAAQKAHKQEKLAKKQEAARESFDEKVDQVGDLAENVGEFAEEIGDEQLGEIAEGVGAATTGLKAVVSLKRMIQDGPSTKEALNLGTSLADLTGYEDVKAVGTLVGAAKEIYEKQQSGEMDTGVALEQLTKVSDQLGKTATAMAKGESLSGALTYSTVESVSSWAASYLPDTSSGVSSWIPGLASASAAYQLYCDGHEYMYGDKDGKPVKNAGSKAVLSGLKLASSFSPAGKLVGMGCDLVRWGISGSSEG